MSHVSPRHSYVKCSRRPIVSRAATTALPVWYFRVRHARFAPRVERTLGIVVDQPAHLQLVEQRGDFIYGLGGESRQIQHVVLAIGKQQQGAMAA